MFLNNEFWSIVFLIVGTVLIILEFGLPTNFEMFAFGLGFYTLSALTFFGVNIWIQILCFTLVVGLTIFIAYKFVRKSTESAQDFSPFALKGKEGKVVLIENDKVIVKVDGEEWLAESKDILEVGDAVIVVDIKGVKLIVEKTKRR